MANGDTTDIDELIKYIESPEYLRMTAYAQGENPDSILSGSPVGRVPTARPAPVVHNVQTCECYRCTEARRLSRQPVPVRLRSRQDGPDKYAPVLSNLRPFDTPTGNLRGRTQVERDGNSGHLAHKSPGAASLWRADQGVIDYVVYSYDTPIAWHVTGPSFSEWVVPDVRYSQTTNMHQSKINAALTYEVGDYVRTIREG